MFFSNTHKAETIRSALALNCVDILVLTGFAVAQPLFRVLAASAGFFVAHRAERVDVLMLVLCAYAVPAGVLIGLELLSAGIAPRALPALHLVSLGFLLTLNVLPLTKRAGLPGAVSLAVALVAGALLVIAYHGVRTWRFSLIYLAPVALLLFPAQLLLLSPVSQLLRAGTTGKDSAVRIKRPVPIVLVVFDELPLASLLDGDGQIDRELYPNFSELARTTTWYRNTTTAGESTLIAIPAIVSGTYPDPARLRLPDANGYPRTLFTLLGGAYEYKVQENSTHLCPDTLCAGDQQPAHQRVLRLSEDAAVLWLYTVVPAQFQRALPDISQSWKDFRAQPEQAPTRAMWSRFVEQTDWEDRAHKFQRSVDTLRASTRPALHYLHIMLPHAPWEYLPTGQRYTIPDSRIRGLTGINDRGEDPTEWTRDTWAVAQSYQRHLLQVGLVDRLTGSLVKQLRAAGLFDSALVIVVADHGTSFRPGDSRRNITATNHADIMAVPLFIKYPGQTEGKIDNRGAETVDILPTIVDVLGAKTNWKLDGHSLLDPAATERRTNLVVTAERKLEFPARFDDVLATVNLKRRLFGGKGPWELYQLGDEFGWAGRAVPSSTPAESGISYQLDRDGYYANVDPRAPLLLTNVTGRLLRRKNVAGEEPVRLAVAVNGTIGAVTESFQDGDREMFSAVVQETTLRAGRNQIAVFRVGNEGELRRIRNASTHQYRWGTPLQFSSTGNASDYGIYGAGWSAPEHGLTWTDGKTATVYLPAPRPPTDLQLAANLRGFTYKALNSQRVHLLVNHHEVARWSVTSGFQDFTARVPREFFGETGTEITFELPDAIPPVTVGGGSDSRTLGVAVVSLQLSPS
jgi:hypothetical protein